LVKRLHFLGGRCRSGSYLVVIQVIDKVCRVQEGVAKECKDHELGVLVGRFDAETARSTAIVLPLGNVLRGLLLRTGSLMATFTTALPGPLKSKDSLCRWRSHTAHTR
jgi:hypothetical protein